MAEQWHAGDGVQRALRSRFPPRLMPGVRRQRQKPKRHNKLHPHVEDQPCMRKAMLLSPLTAFLFITTCRELGRLLWCSSTAGAATATIGAGKLTPLRPTIP